MRWSTALVLMTVTAVGAANGCDSSAGRPEAAAAPTTAAEDSAAINATLDRWYAAMQAGDSAGILAPLTPQFLLLEDTLPLSGLELVARLKQDGGSGKWTYQFSDWHTRRVGDVAWTTLRNHEASQQPDGTPCNADFLETIVLVHDGGQWLIDRYHAAALHRWTCGG
ncbi:MAG: nuclear transport factor 2 family protein [Gemmatimonadales bacterium]